MATKKMTPDEMRDLLERAHAEALRAGRDVNPSPMVVAMSSGELDVVSEGPCGFAWITLRPATSRLARYIKRRGLGDKAYGGGLQMWVGHFGQSYERKYAYARAYAQVLTAAGFAATPGGRLD